MFTLEQLYRFGQGCFCPSSLAFLLTLVAFVIHQPKQASVRKIYVWAIGGFAVLAFLSMFLVLAIQAV